MLVELYPYSSKSTAADTKKILLKRFEKSHGAELFDPVPRSLEWLESKLKQTHLGIAEVVEAANEYRSASNGWIFFRSRAS